MFPASRDGNLASSPGKKVRRLCGMALSATSPIIRWTYDHPERCQRTQY